MATQKRTGGVEKIGLPLADEHSVRKVIRSLAGIFDLDLVSRMFKDESILPAKIVGGIPSGSGGLPGATSHFIANINQTGTNPPVLTTLYNDTGLTFTPSYIDVGSYHVSASGNVTPSILLCRSFTSPEFFVGMLAFGTDIFIETYDLAGNPIDGVINNNSIVLALY